MRLKRVFRCQEGIYTMDGYNPENASMPLLAMHPFFSSPYSVAEIDSEMRELLDHLSRIPEWERDIYDIDLEQMNKQRTYIARFNETITAHPGPIVTMEEANKIHKTAMHFRSLGRKRDAYFIATEPSNPDPVFCTWDDVLDFLLRFEGSRKLGFAGGIYSPEKPEDGCLGYAVCKLNAEDSFELHKMEGLTFWD